MALLANLWKILENLKQAEGEAAQISVNELLLHVAQIVLPLRQSSNAIAYVRRLNVSGCVMN